MTHSSVLRIIRFVCLSKTVKVIHFTLVEYLFTVKMEAHFKMAGKPEIHFCTVMLLYSGFGIISTYQQSVGEIGLCCLTDCPFYMK